MHILVVDPNEAFATLLSEELKRQGYDVDMCFQGSEALRVARENIVDLSILDMALSDPDALTLGQALRAIQADMRFMLIPLMGETLPVQAAGLDIKGVLPKPFFLPDLPGLIGAALGIPSDGVGDAPVERVTEPRRTLPNPPVERAAKRRQTLPDPPRRHSNRVRSGLGGFSREVFASNRSAIEQLMNDLLQDVGADTVLLTFEDELLAWVGVLAQPDAESIAQAVVHGWHTSTEVARILGREQVRFEQSISGGDFMLYALSVESTAILGVVVRGSATLGLLRHRGRSVAEQIARLRIS